MIALIRHRFLQYTLSLSLILLSPLLVTAKTYYVSPGGDDSSTGSQQSPWKTIQKGAVQLLPGDTLIIRDGVYRISSPIRPKNSGTSEKWITYRVLPGEQAVVDAEDFVDANGTYPSRHELGSIQIEKVSFIRFEGLQVRNSRSAGFIVRGPSSHVHLVNCKSDRSYNSGIGIWYSDSVKVLNCEVTGANEQEMRVPGQPTGHEAPHEAISVCGARHFEVAYNHVHHCFKEGIDVKEISAMGVVHHNYVHDLPRQGLYVDAWFGLLHDVVFHSNIVHNCEWGFAISVEGEDSELRGLKFHHNILYNNRASGILFGVWGHNRLRSDIQIFNNTIFNNGSPAHWAGTTGGIDIKSVNMKDVNIYCNIITGNWGYEIGTSIHPEKVSDELAEKNVIIENNITGDFKSMTTEKSFFDIVMYGYQPPVNIVADPLFADPASGDFSIPINSPAAGSASTDIQKEKCMYYGALKPGERTWPR